MLMPESLRFTPLYILSGSCFLYGEEIAAPLPTLEMENMFPPLKGRGQCMSFKCIFVSKKINILTEVKLKLHNLVRFSMFNEAIKAFDLILPL